MSAHVLLNLLNDLGKKVRCEALPSILSVFSNDFNKFNNTGARMQDSIWATTWQNQQNECASSEDSDQPGHPPSLIRVFAVHSMGS